MKPLHHNATGTPGHGVRPEGIVPILPTPFSSDDTIDFEDLKTLVDAAVDFGVTAVGTPAFASEFYKLAGDERTKILKTVIGTPRAHSVRAAVPTPPKTAGMKTTIVEEV